MSAVPAEVKTEKPLTEILVIQDQLPSDLFSNHQAYQSVIKKAVDATTGLIYPEDDFGEKQVKADAAQINKFGKQIEKHIKETFKQETEKASTIRDLLLNELKPLFENRQKALDQFEARRVSKLANIRTMLTDHLNELYGDDVAPEFRKGSIEPMIKLNGTLTPGGKLTAAAIKFCKGLYDTDLFEQKRIEARHLILENRCLKEGINPPLKQVHFGTVFYAEESLFNEKLEELISAELTRIAESKAILEKQQAEETQRRINEALAVQKAEIEGQKKLEDFKKEQGQMREEQIEKAFPEKTTVQQVDDEIARQRRIQADRKNPPVDPVSHKPLAPQEHIAGKRAVNVTATFSGDVIKSQLSEKLQAILVDSTVTATFKFEGISDRVSNQGVADFFKKQLPAELHAILIEAVGENA